MYTTGAVFFNLFEDKAAEQRMDQIREDWRDHVLPVFSIRTTRVTVSDNEWFDFSSWHRWAIGYYAVHTISKNTFEEARMEVESPQKDRTFVPSKGTCIYLSPLSLESTKA